MRAWVTGASGFVGSTLIERLKARGDQIVALVRPQSLGRAPPGVELVIGALPDVSALGALPRPDAVFHCAAVIGCDESVGQAVHVDGTVALAGITQGARFVHVSTTDVLGEHRTGGPVSEEAACAPEDAYGRTKLLAERRLRALRPDAVVLRPPGIYGPRAKLDVVQHMARQIARGRFYHVGDGRALRSWVFVETLVDAMLHAAARPDVDGVFFVDDGRPVSRRELAAEIALEVGRPDDFPHIPTKVAWAVGWLCERTLPGLGLEPPLTSRGVAFRARALPLDTARLKTSGFTHRFTLRESINATVSWARAAGRLT